MKAQAPDAAGTRTLYVTDLDGTLLRSDATLSSESAGLLNAAIARGALVTYATARSFTSSRKVTAALNLELPLITYGGTVTTDPRTGVPTDVQLIPRRIVESALEICVAAGLPPILHTFEGGNDHLRWWPPTITPGTQTFIDLRACDPRLRPITADDRVDLAAVFYIVVLADRRALLPLRDSLLPVLEGCAQFISDDPATPGFDWLEFHTWEGAKSAAIQRLMRSVGADRLVVFGNNHNDLPMFAIADESYSVANAIPEVLAAASGVIDSNDDDAVARWIWHRAQ